MNKFMKCLFCVVLCLSVLALPTKTVEAEGVKTSTGLTGTFETASTNIINNTLSETETGGDAWRKYLNEEFKKRVPAFSWTETANTVPKWSGGVSDNSGDPDPSSNPMAFPTQNSDGAYEIYYPEQLAFALSSPYLVSYNIVIKQDIDMAGYEHEWTITTPQKLTGFTFDGDNHIIYNIGSKKAFITSLKDNSVLKSITFQSAKLVSEKTGTKLLGIVGDFTSEIGQETKLTNVRVQNSLFFSSCDTYSGSDVCYVAPLCDSKGIIANKTASYNNTVYAVAAHAGGAFGVSAYSTISDSYSVDTTVIAGGNHSGGFISCSDGGMTVNNCFTNNTVLGNVETGVFIGALMDNSSKGNRGDTFTNCYTSGSIEGTNQLGGFVGHIDTPFYSPDPVYTFENCYSTSIVGMKNGGSELGGFVGHVDANTNFKNCFAAGEVGSIDTDIAPDSNPTTRSVGGFMGETTTNISLTFTNVYYDKQTTAMREWESGSTRDYLDDSAPGLNNIAGLKGVLTSDSKKFGSGLASQPSTLSTDVKITGFTGFTGDVATRASANIVTNPNGVYDGGNTNSASHNCMYPQLRVFFDSKDAFVRAYSYASAATVHEQVWDTSTYGDPLPVATYDTVRDLTLRFTLTSYVDSDRDNNVGIKWTKSNSKSDIYGQDKSVIGMFQKANNSTYGREYWTADKFSPGIEWVKVEFSITQDGVTSVGSRRLRIIPTSNITPGNDQIDIVVGDKYNHAKDMYMAYSTAKRMSEIVPDITTGVYPDTLPFDSLDPRTDIQKDQNLVTSQFNDDKKKYTVGSEHLTKEARQIDAEKPNNVVNTYLYGVKGFEEKGDGIAKIIYGTKDDALLSTDILNGSKGEERQLAAKQWAAKLAGDAKFTKEDIGRYMIEYIWVMPDGRYMKDSKMIMIQASGHTGSTVILNTADNKPNSSSIMTSLDAFKQGEGIPSPTFTTTFFEKDVSVLHGSPLNMAFKPITPTTTIDKIDFEFTLSDITSSISTQKVVIENVNVDQEFDIPISYYYTSYEENGNYYAKKTTTIKKYTLKHDNVNGYYYLTLNNAFVDANTGVQRYDVECDVKATIYVTDPDPKSEGSVNIATETFVNDIKTEDTKAFEYQILDATGTEVTKFSLTSELNKIKSISLPVGNYTIKQLNSDATGYTLESIKVGETISTVEPYAFTVTKDSTINIVAKNVKTDASFKGKAVVSTETFVNGKQTQDHSLFKYKITGPENYTSEFEISSKTGIQKELDLPVGQYTIEQITNNDYTLESVKVGSTALTVAPYTFTITKGGTINIVTKNVKTEVIQNGKVIVSTETFENGKQVYIDNPFKYQILDTTNKIVKEFEINSKDDKEEITLPIGKYSIKQVTNNGYTLESMNINEQLFMDIYAFSITKDATTTIVVKNVHEGINEPVIKPDDSDKIDTGDASTGPSVYVLLMMVSLLLIGCMQLKKREN